jgi:hypothetical protein
MFTARFALFPLQIVEVPEITAEVYNELIVTVADWPIIAAVQVGAD